MAIDQSDCNLHMGCFLGRVSPQLRTVRAAAADLGVSVHTVRAWIARRKIAHVRLGRAIRVPATEITRLIEHGTVPALPDRPRRWDRRSLSDCRPCMAIFEREVEAAAFGMIRRPRAGDLEGP